jgi:CrcB protein
MSGPDARPVPSVTRAASTDPEADPDVDPQVEGARREWSGHRWVLPVIALGGMTGASARHALDLAWVSGPSQIPGSTLLINASGCLLIGMLMVQVVEVGRAHPLWRPFLGVGALGGYTTFSTYAVQTRELWSHGQAGLSVLYLLLTPALAMTAVAVGVFLARALHRLRNLLAHRKARR